MIQNYELYLIFNPELNSADMDKQIESLQSLLQKEVGATNLRIEIEGLRKMAYAIRKYTTGFYVLTTFDLDDSNTRNMATLERKLNLNETIMRYLIVNQTNFLKQKAKEKLNNTEVTTHRELNKGKTNKKCISKHLGLREIDYKDVDYLSQFVSPYCKIFSREKTGSSAKFQRKITKAIKRARHMALMAFTPQK